MAGLSGSQRHRARAALFGRHHARCFYCSEIVSAKDMTIDHAIPLSRGGTSAKENLRACCKPCNRRKDNLTADEYFDLIEQDARLRA